MEVTAFHRNLIRSSLWPYSSPRGVRPLAGILLYGARTFLSHLHGSGCLIGFPVWIIRLYSANAGPTPAQTRTIMDVAPEPLKCVFGRALQQNVRRMPPHNPLAGECLHDGRYPVRR